MRDNLNQDFRNIRMGKTKESERKNQCAKKENALIMTKDNFLAFIVKVIINVTAMLAQYMKFQLEHVKKFKNVEQQQ